MFALCQSYIYELAAISKPIRLYQYPRFRIIETKLNVILKQRFRWRTFSFANGNIVWRIENAFFVLRIDAYPIYKLSAYQSLIVRNRKSIIQLLFVTNTKQAEKSISSSPES